MPVFETKKDKLLPIKEKKFDLEKDLHKLVEKNIETLFGLELVSSEFNIEGFYIDTLAYDPETESFVILEYKKSKNFSVVDQGLHYLSLLLNNKANFVLAYNQENDTKKDVDDFDWSQVRVLFLSRSFTRYQEGAINFKDFPIELWEVTKYENGLIDFHQIESRKNAESITKISKSADTSKVTKQVKTYTLEDHLRKDWDKTKELFDEFSQRVLEIDPRIDIRPVKYYIGFHIGNSNVVLVKTRSSKLLLELLRVKPKDLKDPEDKTRYKKNSFKHYNKHITQMDIKNEDDIDYAMLLVKQVYKEFFKDN